MSEGLVNYKHQGPLGFPSGDAIDGIAGDFIRAVIRHMLRETVLEIDPWQRETVKENAGPGDLYVHFLLDGFEREALLTASVQNMIEYAVESWTQEMAMDEDGPDYMSARLRGLAEFCLKMAKKAEAIEGRLHSPHRPG